jgi:hypothetical protein
VPAILPALLLAPEVAAAAAVAAKATLAAMAAVAAGIGLAAIASSVKDAAENESQDEKAVEGCPSELGPGTLTDEELKELQDLADKHDAQIDVIGSRAEGRGRNISDTTLPAGKGEGTRSDIDVRIDGQKDIESGGQLSESIQGVGNGAGSVASSTGLPSKPPVIIIRPHSKPVHVK